MHIQRHSYDSAQILPSIHQQNPIRFFHESIRSIHALSSNIYFFRLFLHNSALLFLCGMTKIFATFQCQHLTRITECLHPIFQSARQHSILLNISMDSYKICIGLFWACSFKITVRDLSIGKQASRCLFSCPTTEKTANIH